MHKSKQVEFPTNVLIVPDFEQFLFNLFYVSYRFMSNDDIAFKRCRRKLSMLTIYIFIILWSMPSIMLADSIYFN